jgi:hypothetical protein
VRRVRGACQNTTRIEPHLGLGASVQVSTAAADFVRQHSLQRREGGAITKAHPPCAVQDESIDMILQTPLLIAVLTPKFNMSANGRIVKVNPLYK